jgi:magnesium-protoporphyrin O-methyltransferase
MGDCCPVPRGYEKLFGERTARRDAKRYRRKGLDDTAKVMVDFLRERGLEGRSVLEIGGGVGAIEAEVLRSGADHAVNVELSPYYEAMAHELWRDAGVDERADYRVVDLATDGNDIGPADAVFMHRVVCCYPDYDGLVGAAAERSRRYLVMSFPRERPLIRAVVAAINVVARLLRWEHRSYVHAVAEILASAERRGLQKALEHRGVVWQVAAFERP